MRVMRGDPTAWSRIDGSAASIGMFDGVHRGHQAVLGDLRAKAASAGGLPSAIVSFDEHPLRVVAPDAAPKMLTSEAQRLELFEELGIDIVALLPFREIRDFGPEEFVQKVLVEALGVRVLAVGSDFRFGRDRAGDVTSLRRSGQLLSFEVEAVPLLEEHAQPLSSTEIRIMVAAGRVGEAAEALGRPFELRGEVVQGTGRGGDIGFRTANLEIDPHLVVPGGGVYAAWARCDHVYPAAVNVGIRPTFSEGFEVVEAHLVGFEGDLYGSELALQFDSRLRDEQAFASVEDLVTQIRADVQEVRKRLVEIRGS